MKVSLLNYSRAGSDLVTGEVPEYFQITFAKRLIKSTRVHGLMSNVLKRIFSSVHTLSKKRQLLLELGNLLSAFFIIIFIYSWKM